MFDSIESIQAALFNFQYVANRDLATIIYIALKLNKPLFLEGEAGVGKTEVAKVLASMMDTTLIRLQCYEGLDISNAVYEWDYPRQILHLRMLEASHATRDDMETSLFSREFLLARPLLKALESQAENKLVLLIDEIDRADEEFESFLLELLSDFQITIPEIGTITSEEPPIVVITSNRTREVHDALKRRCLYQWIDYPSFETEYQILKMKVPGVEENLAQQITSIIQQLRAAELYKAPGVAETLDWGRALLAMDVNKLENETIESTLGVVLKYQDDVHRVKEILADEQIDETTRA